MRFTLVLTMLVTSAYAQTPSKLEFEAASLRANPPRSGFRFSTDTGTGGPGTPNPGLFRCADCTLATLISKAYDLQNYQFPGRAALGSNTFEVMARIPAGASPEDFRAMLQNLLKDRFQLTFHYNEKKVRGYHLTVARGGAKLKESAETTAAPAQSDESKQHGSWQSGGHSHSGLVNFGGSASFRANQQSMADLVRALADQLTVPVDDQTGLTARYDINLTWSPDSTSQTAGNHGGGGDGGAGHGDHGGGGGPAAGAGVSSAHGGPSSGPTLFDALQSQLGLKLVSSEQTTAKIFVIDHVEPMPASN